MKLKFELKRAQIEHLLKVLQLVNPLWDQNDKIFIYFDQDMMIIYQAGKAGFDKVVTRVQINNQHLGSSGEKHEFFHNYSIKSQKDKNAILISPVSFPLFIENIKVLTELGYDAYFKLTQTPNNGEIKKYIDIIGSVPSLKDCLRSFVEINCYFDLNLYPDNPTKKEVEFCFDPHFCQAILERFHKRFNIVLDDQAKIVFHATPPNSELFSNGLIEPNFNKRADQLNSQQMNEASKGYWLSLKSQRMHNQINKSICANFYDISNIKDKYKIVLKKEVLNKLFLVMKQSGTAQLRIDHQSTIELNYNLEKCPYIQISLEAQNRQI